MADNSETIPEIFEFHPCDVPKGVLLYNLDDLTEEQQAKLNSHKVDAIRNNHIYLEEHPEIKLITTTLLQGVLKARPKHDIQKFFLKHLMESWPDLKKGVDAIMTEKEQKAASERERQSTLDYLNSLYGEEETEYEKVESEVESESIEIVSEYEQEADAAEETGHGIMEEIIHGLESEEEENAETQSDEADESEAVLDIPGLMDFYLDG